MIRCIASRWVSNGRSACEEYRQSGIVRFEADPVTDGVPKPLLAPEVTFGHDGLLNARRGSEQYQSMKFRIA